MYRYCIVRKEKRILSFLLDDSGRAVEIHGDPCGEKSLLGTICIARVRSVAKNLRAAFVEISPGQLCYLPLEDLERTGQGEGSDDPGPIYTKKGSSPRLQQGDELVVQVSREGIRTKGPAVTTKLTFQGKYVILELGKRGVGVSRKLSEGDRERLKKTMTEIWKGFSEHAMAGIVIRTNAVWTSEEEISRELKALTMQYRRIRETAPYRTCYSRLAEGGEERWLQRLSHLHTGTLKKIVVEDRELYGKAETYLAERMPELSPMLNHYQDKLLAMDKLYSLDRELRDALSERVWLGPAASGEAL